jgi:hypothetical protein
MNRRQFEGEFAQILVMLREHAFLKYSPSGRAEYALKVAAAYLYFRSLTHAATGVVLPEQSELAADLDAVRGSTVSEAVRLLSRQAARQASCDANRQSSTAVSGTRNKARRADADSENCFMQAAGKLRTLR